MADAEAATVVEELRSREPLFHRIERGTSRAAFDAMTAEDFREVGASGARYDRESVWVALAARYSAGAPDDWEVEDFACRSLGGPVVLVTYRLRQGDRVTRRASIWERTSDDWRVVYHQGTQAPRG